ncbi:MAG: hypothetical protein KC492_26220 [Myxococcales bacterium]|nr:hypothetical protein [Myxococcales bacterium]
MSAGTGKERRRHKMFVTRNTEYHFRDRRCVGVRDRKSGNWLTSHLACGRSLSGAVRFQKNGVAIPVNGEPTVGEALYFGEGGRDLLTSILCSVERPEKSVVARYAA